MTKAKQTETAISRIESKINSMSNALDLPCLEMYDAAIGAMIRLTWRLEIITKEDRDRLDVMQCEAYFAIKKQLEEKGGTAA